MWFRVKDLKDCGVLRVKASDKTEDSAVLLLSHLPIKAAGAAVSSEPY